MEKAKSHTSLWGCKMDSPGFLQDCLYRIPMTQKPYSIVHMPKKTGCKVLAENHYPQAHALGNLGLSWGHCRAVEAGGLVDGDGSLGPDH